MTTTSDASKLAAFLSGPDPRTLKTVSMGSCAFCGYAGAGPAHACPVWDAGDEIRRGAEEGELPAPSTVRVVRGDCFELAPSLTGLVNLVVADPPYGDILKEPWDVECYARLGQLLSKILAAGATAYVWGGIGRHRQRHMFRWLASVEDETDLRLWNLITWKKKRAYGKSNDFLFVREECAMLVKGDGPPKTFHVPLLDKLRGYAGYSAKYPAKSPYLRRTNVWDDVTELLRGKIHPAEKPARLAEIMIQTSSNPGDLVVDLFAGSGSTGVASLNVGDRRCVLYEKSDCAMHPLGPREKRTVELETDAVKEKP